MHSQPALHLSQLWRHEIPLGKRSRSLKPSQPPPQSPGHLWFVLTTWSERAVLLLLCTIVKHKL